jgi:hypothetical protein
LGREALRVADVAGNCQASLPYSFHEPTETIHSVKKVLGLVLQVAGFPLR